MFEIKPVNRHLLIGECEDPRLAHEQSQIDTSEARGDLWWGVVLARDESPYLHAATGHQPPAIAEVGDVVYFAPGSVSTLIDKGTQGRMLVHEGQIVAVVKAQTVKMTDANPMNRKKPARNPIHIPTASIVH